VNELLPVFETEGALLGDKSDEGVGCAEKLGVPESMEEAVNNPEDNSLKDIKELSEGDGD